MINASKNKPPSQGEIRASMRALGIKDERYRSAENIVIGGMGTIAGVGLMLMSPHLLEQIQVAVDMGLLPNHMTELKWVFPVAGAVTTTLGVIELRGRSTLDQYDLLRAQAHARETKEGRD